MISKQMKIEEEIKQQKPFSTPYQKASVNILFTASWLSARQSDLLKPYGLTIQQFNILRILRGLKGEPATVKVLTERMIDKMSNASRLVDKLLAKDLVMRQECREDRRRVDIFITEKGLELLEQASNGLENSYRPEFLGISEEEAAILSDLLDKLRN